jgi:uncharacterized protein YjbI with pentapeptide repeats
MTCRNDAISARCGLTEIYHREATTYVDGEDLPESGEVLVTYQGCGENTGCYSPITKSIDLATLFISNGDDSGNRVRTNSTQKLRNSPTTFAVAGGERSDDPPNAPSLTGRRARRTLWLRCRSRRRAPRGARARSQRSRPRSRDGPMAIAPPPREMPHRRRVRRVVKHVIAELAMKRTFGAAALGLGLLAVTATAQDMMRHVDLTSPDMVSAEMTRADVEAALAAATVAAPADFTGKRLSSLDLSGLDLSGAIFRAARLNKTKLAGAKLDRAVLDQAWLLEADLTGASLKGANLFASQMLRARLDGADLSGARVAADLTGASLVGASMVGANLGADMRNQPMGLMRAVLKSANLERLDARGADLSRVDLEFASLKGADLTGASLKSAQLGGADLTGVTVIDTDFDGADLVSAKLIAPIGLDQAKNFDKAKNRDRLIKE